VRVRHTHARGGAVPGEDHVGCRIDLVEIRQLAVIGFDQRDVLEFQLLDHIGDPAFAEGFPRQHRDRPRAEHRPQPHLDRPGVGSRHDADAVSGRNFEDFAGQLDGASELGAAGLGPVRAADERVGEGLQVPAGALGAWAGGEVRDERPHAGLGDGHDLPLQIGAPRWGGVSRARQYGKEAISSSAEAEDHEG